MDILLKNLFRYQDQGLLFYRIVFGLSMMAHGYFKFAGGEQVLTAVGSMLGVFGITGGYYMLGIMAASAELIGGLLVLLGLGTTDCRYFIRGYCIGIGQWLLKMGLSVSDDVWCYYALYCRPGSFQL